MNSQVTHKVIDTESSCKPLSVAIIGGGKACFDLLKILHGKRLSGLNMKILGVADINPEAPGLLYAKELKLFVTSDFNALYNLKDLNLLIELTDSEG